MSEHYTKSTVSASVFCAKCGKFTQHRIDTGRRGPCEVCMERPLAETKKPPVPERGLFDDLEGAR
jgi:hypothetical protein